MLWIVSVIELYAENIVMVRKYELIDYSNFFKSTIKRRLH